MIDIEMLTKKFAGDKGFVSLIFKQYLTENKDINTHIEHQFEDKALPALFDTLHILSGSLANICENEIITTIRKVEKLSRNNELASVDDIKQITSELDKIKLQMEQYLA